MIELPPWAPRHQRYGVHGARARRVILCYMRCFRWMAFPSLTASLTSALHGLSLRVLFTMSAARAKLHVLKGLIMHVIPQIANRGWDYLWKWWLDRAAPFPTTLTALLS